MGTKYSPKAKADRTLDVLAMPDQVIPDATSAKKVGKGNMLRVSGSASQYLAFGKDSMDAPTSNTPNAIETPADYFVIIATDDYVRTSAVMRIEVIKD